MLGMITFMLAAVPVDFDRLAAGPPPAVAWYADGGIHHGETAVPLEGRSLSDFVQVRGGYVAHVRGAEAADDRLVLLRDGREKTLAEAPGDASEVFGPVVSPDGRRVAWSVVRGLDGVAPTSGTSSTLVLARASDGTVLARKTVRDDLWVVGLVGDTVVANRGLDAGVVSWDTAADRLTEWRDADEVTAVSGRHGLVAVTDDTRCTTVRPFGEHRTLWKTCGAAIIGFDPDGRYAVTRKDDADGVDVGLRQARSGNPVLRLRTGGGTPEPAWEPSGTLLLTAWDETRMAIVRCTTTGACEFARPPRPATAGWPYLLPDQ